jgi:hypothetical protein
VQLAKHILNPSRMSPSHRSSRLRFGDGSAVELDAFHLGTLRYQVFGRFSDAGIEIPDQMA